MERRLPPPASSNTEPGADVHLLGYPHLWRRRRLYRHGVRPRRRHHVGTLREMRTATVTNTNPTATIDLSSATIVNGVPTIIAKALPTTFSAQSTDPGSDDLTVGHGPTAPPIRSRRI